MSTAIYVKTAGDLIRDALRDASIVAVGIPITGEDWSIAESVLNNVLSHWQSTLGINLWRETEALLPLNPNQKEYSLGVGGDHCFTDYAYATCINNEIAGATVIEISNGTDIINDGYGAGDFIGIEQDDGNRHWTEILTIASGSITIDNPMLENASAGSSIYIYQNKIDRPIRVLDARHAIGETESETPVDQLSRQQYYQIPNKTDSASSVNQFYYSPQLNLGKLSVWPPSDACRRVLRFTFVKPQYIPEDQSEDILIPNEWFLPLKWALASELGVTYAISPERLVAIESKAEKSLDSAMSGDVEVNYFSIQPE